ncbi:ATP-grasp domain-containing protein [Candidatus Pelagibacter ubique]|nr:ATP-grasp domain-containing protein [Candidatus Pelagibacter ubique]MDA9170317.1 ATP-grasp domain-containing protein [Candidatus Pelagibacter ubique]
MKFSKYIWIIGGGQLQIPLVEEAKKLGYSTIVTDVNPNCVCSDIADIFETVDIFDIESNISLYERSFKTDLSIEIAGVLAAGIDAHQTMAYLSNHMGLVSVSPEIADLVSNKDLFRERMKKLGLETPRFKSITINDIPNLKNLTDQIGYPLIIKNTSSSGSRGTKIFYEPNIEEMILTTKEAINVSRSKRALIESFWVGTEHTVETIFDINGDFHRCFITDRIFDKSNGFALETGLVHPSQLTEQMKESMYNLAEKTSKLIGVEVGASKFDMIYTNTGPKIIEMTVRLSGGFDCQYLVPSATGKNILKAALLTCVGKPFDNDCLKSKFRKVAISESLWPKPGGVIKAINGVEEVKKMPGFENIFFRYGVGDYINDYIDCTKRVCFIICSGLTLAETRENMLKIKEKVNFSIEK